MCPHKTSLLPAKPTQKISVQDIFEKSVLNAQALLDEGALLACMASVDLNPIRVRIATTPEQSSFTRIQLGIKAAIKGEQPSMLLPFTSNEHQEKSVGISFSWKDYLTLVDETRRVIREDKRGAINTNTAQILSRLHSSDKSGLKSSPQILKVFSPVLWVLLSMWV